MVNNVIIIDNKILAQCSIEETEGREPTKEEEEIITNHLEYKIVNGHAVKDGAAQDITDKQKFRFLRETQCFPIINRGILWFNYLTMDQQDDLLTWYQAWLNVTDTKVIPTKPSWLK